MSHAHARTLSEQEIRELPLDDLVDRMGYCDYEPAEPDKCDDCAAYMEVQRREEEVAHAPHLPYDFNDTPETTSAGTCHPEIEVERRVDTVIIRQGDNEIQLDEWCVKGLREALYALAPREIGP